MSVKSVTHNIFSLKVVFSTNLTLTLNENYIIVIVSVWTMYLVLARKSDSVNVFENDFGARDMRRQVHEYNRCCFDEILEMFFL